MTWGKGINECPLHQYLNDGEKTLRWGKPGNRRKWEAPWHLREQRVCQDAGGSCSRC